MKAYCINRDGTVTSHEGEDETFWEDEDIVYAEIETPQFPGNAIYYDDESLQDPGEVRVIVAGVEIPLPAWFVGVNGEDLCNPTVTAEDVSKTIRLPA